MITIFTHLVSLGRKLPITHCASSRLTLSLKLSAQPISVGSINPHYQPAWATISSSTLIAPDGSSTNIINHRAIVNPVNRCEQHIQMHSTPLDPSRSFLGSEPSNRPHQVWPLPDFGAPEIAENIFDGRQGVRQTILHDVVWEGHWLNDLNDENYLERAERGEKELKHAMQPSVRICKSVQSGPPGGISWVINPFNW